MAMHGKIDTLTPYGGGNFGMPMELVDTLMVPNDRFFVRSNGPTPEISREEWKLSITGLVDQAVTVNFDDLLKLPRKTFAAWLECCGNGRTRFDPPAEGTPWVNDAAGNAEWTGTSLSHVLDMAGVGNDAIDIIARGADFDGMERGLPIWVARDPHTLLVWEMNGEPLPVPHGGPVRLLVPRWGGIASTKWIKEIEVSSMPFTGHFNTTVYTLQTEANEMVVPVREMPVKSIISTPLEGATIAAGDAIVAGFAWSGYGGISRVDVSVDGGETWSEADIVAEAGPLSWVRFEHPFSATPGALTVCSRATDQRNLVQPAVAAWNAKGYQMNAIQRVTVTVT